MSNKTSRHPLPYRARSILGSAFGRGVNVTPKFYQRARSKPSSFPTTYHNVQRTPLRKQQHLHSARHQATRSTMVYRPLERGVQTAAASGREKLYTPASLHHIDGRARGTAVPDKKGGGRRSIDLSASAIRKGGNLCPRPTRRIRDSR